MTFQSNQKTICQTIRELYFSIYSSTTILLKDKEQALKQIEEIYITFKKLNKRLVQLNGQDDSVCGNEEVWLKQIKDYINK
jgi:hypothetical protein